MRTIYTKLLVLLLVLSTGACNKEGDATLVMEEGQPSVSMLLVGQWKPTKKQWINKQTGNILKEEPVDEEDSSVWQFFEDGTFGKSNDQGKRLNWRVNEEDHTLYLDNEKWSIGALTKKKMLLYLEGKQQGGESEEYENYFPGYLFGRIGEYEWNEEPDTPAAGSKVSRIVETTTYLHSSNKNVTTYSFSYDSKGRISKYVMEHAASQNSFEYEYEDRQVVVSGPESYRGVLNENGFIETLKSMDRDQTVVASASYDQQGYLSVFNNKKMFYDKNKNLVNSDRFEYLYAKEANDANIDLNCFLSDCSNYEFDYGHYSLFAPFGMYGKASVNMVAEQHFQVQAADYYYSYAYERDEKNRISEITRKSISNYNYDQTLNTTEFAIYYE